MGMGAKCTCNCLLQLHPCGPGLKAGGVKCSGCCTQLIWLQHTPPVVLLPSISHQLEELTDGDLGMCSSCLCETRHVDGLQG
jgi:hypothetical protein